MFDAIKTILGRTSCRGCIYRHFGGLYCGNNKKDVILHKSAWQKYGCWYYEDTSIYSEKSENESEETK